MNYKGPIVIVDDDEDDQQIYKDAFDSLGYGNKIIPFEDGEKAFEYLQQAEEMPFLIISDVRLPKIDGFGLKKKLLNDKKLGSASIPFVFFTSAKNKETVKDAFNVSVQGFFLKEHSLKELENTIKTIMDYWSKSFTPNKG